MKDTEKKLVGYAAAEYVRDGMTIGLGTGKTVRYFAGTLGERIRKGLRLRAVPTSEQSQGLAEANGIPLIDWDELEEIDLCVDGADEIAPDFSMIKGGGGALLWEKIVASASRRRIYIADSSKLVAQLGAFPLPVEVCRFGHPHVGRQLRVVSNDTRLRGDGGAPFVTSSGNFIYDCHFGEIADPAALHTRLINIPGVVETGLFVGTVDMLISCRDCEVVSRSPDAGAWWS